MQTILVTDKPKSWNFAEEFSPVIDVTDYLANEEYANGKPFRIVNLCRSYKYQTTGYYVSLLAQARGHKVVPSVTTIQDFKNSILAKTISEEIEYDIQHALRDIRSKEFILSIYFGRNIAKCYDELSRKLHQLFPAPLFRVYFQFKKQKWFIKRLTTIEMDEVPEHHQSFMVESAKNYLNKKRFYITKKQNRIYDLAILLNSKEEKPPSNKKAIDKFVKAGENLGLNVSLIEKEEFKSLSEYDALFIRETTAVNHHTYRFARKAAAEGLIVLDDPMSILRCTNKVFLAEILNKHRIKSPTTLIVNKQNYKTIMDTIKYPCVLKQPDSAFSQGVIKVSSKENFVQAVEEFLKQSELIIVQEYMPTDYDWRIGILDNKPIYACQYYMAKGHWQIYNWASNKSCEGMHTTIPLEKVPKIVIETALKTTKHIGSGLYGVDLKQHQDNVYVIEVNDNPSIESGVEDEVLGDEIYSTIMNYFLNNLKRLHNND